jgi:hypothetical protein
VEQKTSGDEKQGPFDNVIRQIDRIEVEPERHLSIQIDNDVRAMIRSATQTGQAASVTIKLVAKRKGELIEITGTCTPKLPKPPVGSVRMYADEFGDLFNHNPNYVTSSLPGIDARTPARQPDKAKNIPINAEAK